MVEPPVLPPAPSPIRNKPPVLRTIRGRTISSTTYHGSIGVSPVLPPAPSPIRGKTPVLPTILVERSVLPPILPIISHEKQFGGPSSHQSMVEPPVLPPAPSPIRNKPPVLRQIRCRTVGSTTYHESIVQHPVLPPAPSPIRGRTARTANNSGRTIGSTTHSAHHFSAKNNSEALPPINPW